MAVLSVITRIWNVLVETNTFNFIIFIALLALIFKKINIHSMITSIQEKLIKIIEEAKNSQKEATEALLNAEKSLENLDDDLKVIVSEAEKSAEVIGKKILSEAEKQIQSIESNALKVIDAEEKLLISKLTKNTSKASVQIAQSHVEKVLQETPTLHDKYIDESIDELDRLSL